MRELAIEDKLASISDEWADEQLAFAQFKSRGPIALKVRVRARARARARVRVRVRVRVRARVS